MVCLFVYVCGGQVRQLYPNEGSWYISSQALELLLTEQVGRQTEEQTLTPLPWTEHFQCLCDLLSPSARHHLTSSLRVHLQFQENFSHSFIPCGAESSFTSAGPTCTNREFFESSHTKVMAQFVKTCETVGKLGVGKCAYCWFVLLQLNRAELPALSDYEERTGAVCPGPAVAQQLSQRTGEEAPSTLH